MSHVFEERTGRRWRAVRLVLACFLTALLLVGLVLATTTAQSPQLGSRTPGPSLTEADLGERLPVVGRGPLERVLRVDRTLSGLAGVDPFVPGVRVPLDPALAPEIGGARYVLQRFGYDAGTTKVIALTFDDGPNRRVTPELLDFLARERIPATFFTIGSAVSREPETVIRASNEGHAVASHTLTHPSLTTVPDWRQQAEIVIAERQLRALTGRGTRLWRMPGSSANPEGEALGEILRAQRLGYLHVGHDFDPLDPAHSGSSEDSAQLPVPDFELGWNHTVLLPDGHDAAMLAYARRLVAEAKRHGYTFVTVPHLAARTSAVDAPVPVGIADHVAHGLAETLFRGPDLVMNGLFWAALALMAGTVVLHTGLAWGRRWHRRRRLAPIPALERTPVLVSVVLAAYNEEAVIERTLHSILASRSDFHELIVVDDGSTDETSDRVRRVARIDPRVRLIRQPNGGKAAALNRAIGEASGDVVLTFDADTVIASHTIRHLVEHFERDRAGTLGAVAGVVRVGNRTTNLITRWQALDYVSQIGLERSAQDALGAISIVPGACAGWRREAVLRCGGFAADTLAEDCDLALHLHRDGWRITQDDRARAFTEAPSTLDDLLRQRERWAYGTLQAMVKNRDLLFNPRMRALGLYVMPNYAFTLLMPFVFLPFVTVGALLLVIREGPAVPLLFYGLFMVIQMIQCTVSVALMGDSHRHLAMVPLYRLINDPLRAYLIYLSVYRAVRGRPQGWNKLVRTGELDAVPARTRVRPPGCAAVPEAA